MSSILVPADSWITGLFASIDRKDTDGFASFLTEDALFRFGNQPTVHGRDAIGAAVDGFFSSIAGLAHRIERIWEHSDSVVCHGEVSYERLDGSSTTLPFADVFIMRDDLVREYLIYMDVTPLFADVG